LFGYSNLGNCSMRSISGIKARTKLRHPCNIKAG
jgi:hypothetical protein